jgi:hypothetical protein
MPVTVVLYDTPITVTSPPTRNPRSAKNPQIQSYSMYCTDCTCTHVISDCPPPHSPRASISQHLLQTVTPEREGGEEAHRIADASLTTGLPLARNSVIKFSWRWRWHILVLEERVGVPPLQAGRR